jgi:ABC-type multidrug transport system permease subunit
MNHRRVLVLVRFQLKRHLREPAFLFLVVLFPIMLIVFFGAAFGGIGGSQQATYSVGLVNLNSSSPSGPCLQSFAGNLTATQILKTSAFADNESAQSELTQGNLQAVIVVPSNFERSCQLYQRNPANASSWETSTVQLYLDSGSMFAAQAIPPIVQHVLTASVSGIAPSADPTPILLGTPSMITVTKLTSFDYMVPGIFAYAAIFLTMTVAQSFTADREKGLLRRVNTTPTSPSEFMASNAVSNMVLALVQVGLIFGMAFLIGYRPMGGVPSFLMAFGLVSLFALCSVGFGLITATISKSSGAATGISFLFIMPQMFLGTFVALNLTGTMQEAAAFVPSHYVTDALTSLFLRGAPVTSPGILTDLAVISAVSIIVLLSGIALFKRYGTS